jgi:hypothetical protein
MRWHAGARDFAGCIAVLTPVAPADPPSATLMQRAKLFLKQPPAATWNAVNKLEGKQAANRAGPSAHSREGGNPKN